MPQRVRLDIQYYIKQVILNEYNQGRVKTIKDFIYWTRYWGVSTMLGDTKESFRKFICKVFGHKRRHIKDHNIGKQGIGCIRCKKGKVLFL